MLQPVQATCADIRCYNRTFNNDQAGTSAFFCSLVEDIYILYEYEYKHKHGGAFLQHVHPQTWLHKYGPPLTQQGRLNPPVQTPLSGFCYQGKYDNLLKGANMSEASFDSTSYPVFLHPRRLVARMQSRACARYTRTQRSDD